jgi:hypothetical protein
VIDRSQTEVTIQIRLIEMPTLLWEIRLGLKLLSEIRIRGADLLTAMKEALPNTLSQGYQSDAAKRLFVS